MPKNKGRGKNRRRGTNDAEDEKRELEFKKEGFFGGRNGGRGGRSASSFGGRSSFGGGRDGNRFSSGGYQQ
ncbi:hypothetical protein Tco_0077086 [Tanacetum coccineum]